MPPHPRRTLFNWAVTSDSTSVYLLFLFGSLHLRNFQLAWILVWFHLPQLGLQTSYDKSLEMCSAQLLPGVFSELKPALPIILPLYVQILLSVLPDPYSRLSKTNVRILKFSKKLLRMQLQDLASNPFCNSSPQPAVYWAWSCDNAAVPLRQRTAAKMKIAMPFQRLDMKNVGSFW